MNKDDILEIAQKRQEDERYSSVLLHSTGFSLIIVYVTMLFLLVWRWSYQESVIDYGLILLSQVIAFSLYQYRKLPERKIYVFSIVFGILSFIVLVILLLGEYGVFQ